ncbi:putative DNA-binding transcriptional regulator YafY [Microbacterium halimionae]|uniref:Putative DNA-binding transcriptional regulator YafY n=1 Tax=Microbacterium halimionae TaxID=1526413 RepID=A0A7W3PLP8_9MICO|nr:hypothetical protein [Microbacterium halimionae]MBA8816177.1 putative DNA-binding transcriptional regulator YafY [Microbacterium halimionae]NII96379.1 putative DNA-binding transcriptional regulator YafY [Microbacterium halimionae]
MDADPTNDGLERAARIQRRLNDQLNICVSQRQVYRYLAAYRAAGVAGLADSRKTRTIREVKTDPRVSDLIEAELESQQATSTGTMSRTIARVQWEASQRDIPLPAAHDVSIARATGSKAWDFWCSNYRSVNGRET